MRKIPQIVQRFGSIAGHHDLVLNITILKCELGDVEYALVSP